MPNEGHIYMLINQSINQSPAVLVPLLKLKLAMYMCCCCNRNATVAIASAVLYWKPLFAQHGSISVRAYAAAAHVHDVRILLLYLYCCLLSAMIALHAVLCISNSAFLSAYSTRYRTAACRSGLGVEKQNVIEAQQFPYYVYVCRPRPRAGAMGSKTSPTFNVLEAPERRASADEQAVRCEQRRRTKHGYEHGCQYPIERCAQRTVYSVFLHT